MAYIEHQYNICNIVIHCQFNMLQHCDYVFTISVYNTATLTVLNSAGFSPTVPVHPIIPARMHVLPETMTTKAGMAKSSRSTNGEYSFRII